MVFIREAQIEEAEAISACLNSAFEPFRSQYTTRAFDDTVPSPGAIRERMVHMKLYVAITSEGEIVGTIASGMQGEEGHLRGMAIRPPWQGRDIAEQLLRTAENDLLAGGCKRITLDTTLHCNERFVSIARMASSPRAVSRISLVCLCYEYAKPSVLR